MATWLPFVQETGSQEDTEAFIRSVLADQENREAVFVIWYGDQFAGLIGMKDTDLQNLRTEIGYWLIEKMTGRGIMKRSAETLIGYIFLSLGLNRIQIRCGVGNHKSAAVARRLGFRFEGVERAGEKHRNGFIDLEVYSLLRKEWEER